MWSKSARAPMKQWSSKHATHGKRHHEHRAAPSRFGTREADAQPLKRAQVGVLDGTLEERIAAAFGKTNSGDVAILIAEAESAAITSGEEAGAARTRALDPTLSASDMAVARRAMEDGFFKRDRMQEAVRRLCERLQEVKA